MSRWIFGAAVAASLLAPFSALACLILISGVMLSTSVRHISSVRTPIEWAMATWLIWVPLSVTWAYATGLALEVGSWLLCIPLSWLLAKSLIEKNELKKLLESLGPVVLAGLVIWGGLQGPATISGRPQGPLNDTNTYATVLSLFLVPILAKYLTSDINNSRVSLRIARLGLVGSTALIFFLVASKGGSLSLMIALGLLLLKARYCDAFNKKVLLLSFVLAVAYIIAGFVGGDQLGLAGRLAYTVAQGDAPRWNLILSSLSMVADHPWLGTGFGSFQYLYPHYRMPQETGSGGGWVHNDYLQFWLEGGVVMLILLVSILAIVVVNLKKTINERGDEELERYGYLLAVLVAFIHASINFIFYFPVVGVLVGAYLAQSLPCVNSRETMLPRELKLIASGYLLILGYLLLTFVAVDCLLLNRSIVQRFAWTCGMYYPYFNVAYWLSVLNPFHHGPRLAMGKEYAEYWELLGKKNNDLRNGAIGEINASLHLLPCDPIATSELLSLLARADIDTTQYQMALTYLGDAQRCDPKSGLTYYYGGQIMYQRNPSMALEYWRYGIAASTRRGERLLLASMVLSIEMPEYAKLFSNKALEIERIWRGVESNAQTGVGRDYGDLTQYQLRSWGRDRFDALMTLSGRSEN